MFFNPGESLKKLKPDTKITGAIWSIVLLVIVSGVIMLPIITSHDYYDALYRIVIRQQADSGKDLGEKEKIQIKDYLHSGINKTIQIFSHFAGKLVSVFLYYLLFYSLILWGLSSLFKINIGFSYSFKIMVCLYIIFCLELILISIMVVVSDWKPLLANAKNMKDFTSVLMAYTSLAVIWDMSEIGVVPFYLLNYLTNIFIYIYFGYFYLVLTGSVNIEKKLAIKMTIIFALIIGLLNIISGVPLMFMK